MHFHLDVPEELARQFGAEHGGITRVKTEALSLEGVRSGNLTEHQAHEMLGIRSRYEMDGFLKVHGVPLPTTLEQIVADSETAIAFSRKNHEMGGAKTGRAGIPVGAPGGGSQSTRPRAWRTPTDRGGEEMSTGIRGGGGRGDTHRCQEREGCGMVCELRRSAAAGCSVFPAAAADDR